MGHILMERGKTMVKAGLRGLLISAAAVSALTASSFSFIGTFATGDNAQYLTFSASGLTTIRTLSYGGGTNISGSLIAAGGFDPLLNIFDDTGAQLGSFDDSAAGGGCSAGITSGSNGCLDSYFSNILEPGTYTLVLTQFDNVFSGLTLADGFFWQEACSAVFCDDFNHTAPRTGNWSLDIIGANSAAETTAAPEPGSVGLLAIGIIVLAFLRQRLFPCFPDCPPAFCSRIQAERCVVACQPRRYGLTL
jgi:hypothetical protein